MTNPSQSPEDRKQLSSCQLLGGYPGGEDDCFSGHSLNNQAVSSVWWWAIVVVSGIMAEKSFSRKKKDKVFDHLKTQLEEKQDARSVKRDHKEEEFYVDKHRQAAVTLGERDVASDVKAKKRRER